MSGSPNDLPNAIANVVQQARNRDRARRDSIRETQWLGADAQVKVTNLTGHRFPSGVAFRRAFIEFSVIERRNGRDDILWASGKTNADGVIVDGNGAPLRPNYSSPVM